MSNPQMYKSIAIAGLPKSGKSALINALVKSLPDWEVHSIGGILRERYDDWKSKSNSHLTFEEYYKKIVTMEDIINVNNEARALLEKGKIILDSRFAKLNSAGLSDVLLVFLKAKLDVRAERAKEAYPGKNIEEIKNILRGREEDEKNWGQNIFNFTYNAEENYSSSLIIDSSELTISEEANLILSKLENKSKIFIITGPSGAGKTTILEEILKSNQDIARVITYTTREKRENEIDGKDYHFISKPEFLEKISSGEMFEHAEVYGSLYGSSKKEVKKLLETDRKILFAIDLKGAETIKKIFPESIEIFILPPSLTELEKRINKRGDKNKSDIAKRLSEAEKEMEKSKFFKYVIVNDELGKAISEVMKIIH